MTELDVGQNGLVTRISEPSTAEVRQSSLSADDVVGSGFVDIHGHGGDGKTFGQATDEAGMRSDARAIIAFHRQHCTTSLLASLVSAPIDTMSRQLRVLTTLTIAPELPGAIDAIRTLREHGVTVAIGHTAATTAGTNAAIRAGHVVDDVIGWQFDALGADRIALVTDAIGATGCGDGEYHLGDVDLVVRGGLAALADGSSLAGSTTTMDAVFRRCLAIGVPIRHVVRVSSATPAAAIGAVNRGVIEVGRRADLVVLDAQHGVKRVMLAGRWLNP
jgi:N-acetylglucosamine-6-phosphate deacetylase